MALELYGGCRWIENLILPQIDLLKFEINLLEAEKIKLPNAYQISQKKDCKSNIMVQFCVKYAFRIKFGPQEEPESEKLTLKTLF